jgi:hypothetical protein
MTTPTLTAPEESAFAHIAHFLENVLFPERGDLLETKAIAEHTERRFYMGAQLAEADEQTRLLEGILAGASLPADVLKAELEAIAQ